MLYIYIIIYRRNKYASTRTSGNSYIIISVYKDNGDISAV